MTDRSILDDLTAAALAREFAAIPGDSPGSDGELPDPLPTIPATSPIMRRLRAELEHTVAGSTPDSPLQHLVSRVLRGHTDFRTALSDADFPAPSRGNLGPEVNAFVDRQNEANTS